MNVRFSDALPLARRHGCSSVADLRVYSSLGSGCGLCIPYMQRALMTGETDLPVLGPSESAALLLRSGLAPTDETPGGTS